MKNQGNGDPPEGKRPNPPPGPPNLSVITGRLNITGPDFGEAIAALSMIAKIRKASYDAHIAEGFTEDQALELCIDLGC